MTDLGTMLGVWAHPDDETYLTAGLMAKAVGDGNRVVCVTATRGEGGSFDEGRWPTATMGDVRENELMRCFEILGVKEHHWLDFPDVDMDTALPDEGAGRVRTIMESVEPDSVLTFGPDGMTGHEGHKSVSRWTTEAFEQVAKPGAKLYYATMTPEWVKEFASRMSKFNVFRPGTPPVTPVEELAINFELPPGLLDLKMKAVEAHESQVVYMLEFFGDDFFREGNKAETFKLAAER